MEPYLSRGGFILFIVFPGPNGMDCEDKEKAGAEKAPFIALGEAARSVIALDPINSASRHPRGPKTQAVRCT